MKNGPGAVIRTVRSARGLTQAQLAAKAGLPQSHVAKLESGKVDMQWSTLTRIFRAMGCEAVVSAQGFETRSKTAVRFLDKDDVCNDDRDTLRFWQRQPPSARIDAVEFLRRQCYLASGQKSLPSLVRVVRISDR